MYITIKEGGHISGRLRSKTEKNNNSHSRDSDRHVLHHDRAVRMDDPDCFKDKSGIYIRLPVLYSAA